MKKIISWLHHFFIPSDGNQYRARALHIDMLTAYLVIAIFLGFLYRLVPVMPLGEIILGIATDISSQQLLECTNAKRAENGLPSLSYNPQLEQAARAKAQDMFKQNYWNHYGPNGETPWRFILSSGYTYTFAGENLARDFLFSRDVCDAWMASPSHRENMLRDVYDNVGFAVVDGVLQDETTTLVVQMFGRKEQTDIKTSKLAQAEPIPSPTIPPTTLSTNTPIQPKYPVTLLRVAGLNSLQYKSSIVFMIILTLALIADLYYAHRLGIMRVSGKHLAHLVFVAAILAGFWILSKGTITTQAALQ